MRSANVACGLLPLHNNATGICGSRRRRGLPSITYSYPDPSRPRKRWRRLLGPSRSCACSSPGRHGIPVGIDHLANHALQPLEAGGHALRGAAGLLRAWGIGAGVGAAPLYALAAGGRAIAFEF